MYRIQEMTDNYQLLNDIEQWNRAEFTAQQQSRKNRSEIEGLICRERFLTPKNWYIYHVKSVRSNGQIYTLLFSSNKLICSCVDHSHTGLTCKHGYAVLRSLDYDNLGEYLEIKAIAQGKEERCFEGRTYKL